MENISLTHRIVGAIVILSLAIIFVPILLETDQIDPGHLKESPVPEIPEELATIVFELDKVSGDFEAKNADKIAQFETGIQQEIESSSQEIALSEVVAEPAPAPLSTPKSVVTAPVKNEAPFPVDVDEPFKHTWMLQLASFKGETKALSFRDRLRKAGYSAHLNQRNGDNGTMWRVRIGPYTRKDEAKTVLAKVNKEFKVKGLLVQRR